MTSRFNSNNKTTHLVDKRHDSYTHKSKQFTPIPSPIQFLFGTFSACGATMVTHPIDVVKYAQQLNRSTGGSSFTFAKRIISKNGPSGLYFGLSASMMRQVSYGTIRLGLYQTLLEKSTASTGSPPALWQKLLFSVIAGGTGAFFGNPFDLVLVRMAADGTLPEAQRRNYKSVFDGVFSIIRREGFTALWTGASPTMYRCMMLNMAQLSTYSQAKEELLKTYYFNDNIVTHVTASMIAGLVATTSSTPLDVAKTRIQQDKTGEYKGMANCLIKTVRNEGILSAWKGFGPSYMRLAPQTVLVFVFLEQLQLFYRKWI